MRAVEIGEPGGPDALRPCRRPRPSAGPGEVLIDVSAAGVNGPDIAQRKGLYPPPPGASDLPGLEVSGTVAAIGEGVEAWAVGDPVCALTNGGGYAEAVAVPAGQCLPIPEGVDLRDAAGLPETYFTVWANFFLDRDWPAGTRFLVHGGAGGIGSTAVQLGRAFGMEMFATCSAPKKDFVQSLGATAIDYAHEDFVAVLKGAGGADVILDMLGGDYVERNLKAAAPDGLIVNLAFNRGAKVEANMMALMVKRLTWTGSTLRPRDGAFKARVADGLRERAWPLFANGRLRTVTHATFPLERAADAHRAMEAGEHTGKILLTV